MNIQGHVKRMFHDNNSILLDLNWRAPAVSSLETQGSHLKVASETKGPVRELQLIPSRLGIGATIGGFATYPARYQDLRHCDLLRRNGFEEQHSMWCASEDAEESRSGYVVSNGPPSPQGLYFRAS